MSMRSTWPNFLSRLGAVSAAPAHLVLQRELARRQSSAPADSRLPSAAGAALAATAPRAGIYAIRNRVNGRFYVSGDADVQGALDHDRFELKRNRHRNAALQADWKWFGEQNFSFDVVAVLEARQRDHLSQMLDEWRDKLRAYGETGYNARMRVPL